MDGLAWAWVYIGVPTVLLVALCWMLVGCIDVVRGIFSLAVPGDPRPLPKIRVPGAGGVLAGMALSIAPGAAIYRSQEANNCTTDCSVFSQYRNHVAWTSALYVAIALVLVAALWSLSRRFQWRWMG